MKRVIYFLMALVFITGCNQYEYELSDPGLTVKESVLDFAAKGGDGYILVESDTPIEAKSNSDWCQIRVVDKKIEVTVAPYSGIENRTAVVSITAGKDFPVNVPVTQSAARFIIEDLVFDVDFILTSVKTAVISDEEVTVSSSDEWIETNYENDSIFITVAFNPKDEIRTGTVTVTSGIISQTITINQAARRFTFEEFLGDWTLSYISSIEGETSRSSMDVQLLTNEDGKSFRLGPISNGGTGSGYLLVDYSVENARTIFRIRNAQSLPNYGSYLIRVVAWNAQTSFSTATTISYQGSYLDDNGTVTIQFADNGSWPDYQVNGLLVAAFNSAGTYAGSLYSLDYVIMTKK